MADVALEPRGLLRNETPDVALVGAPVAGVQERARHLLHARGAALRKLRPRRRRKGARPVLPPPGLDARDRNGRGAGRRDENREIQDPVLLGADQFFAVHQQHRPVALHHDLQLGHLAGVAHLGDLAPSRPRAPRPG